MTARKHTYRWLAQALLGALIALIVFASGLWGSLALGYRASRRPAIRYVASGLWTAWVITLFTLAVILAQLWPLALHGLALLALLLWWATLRPSNDRLWSDDVARLLQGTVQGNIATLHNVRNFHWRSEADYDVCWETRQYPLDQLTSADAVISFWGIRAIAHAMLSFGFDDGRHLVFSVEIRRERGEAFSSLGGFFKQFELTLVAADERDIIRVRTNVRGEDDYLYPLHMDRAAMRSLFESYVEAANALARTPHWYHTVGSNCTTIVYRMARRIDPGLPMDLRLLLTGYLPEYLYDNGMLDERLSLEQWKRRSRITARARKTAPDGDFSRAIRATATSDAT